MISYDLLDKVLNKEYLAVWEEVKYIGIDIIANANIRYLVCSNLINMYNDKLSKNFITTYIRYLKYYREQPDIFIDSRNRDKIYKELISPTLNQKGIVKDLSTIKW